LEDPGEDVPYGLSHFHVNRSTTCYIKYA